MASPPADRLFVYGTLRRDAPRNPWRRQLAAAARWDGEAWLQARLYAVADYPAVVLSASPADQVRGEIWVLRQPRGLWPRLDAYEGCAADSPRPHEYRRRPCLVRRADGRALRAWVYLYNRPPRGLRRIASGDFLG